MEQLLEVRNRELLERSLGKGRFDEAEISEEKSFD